MDNERKAAVPGTVGAIVLPPVCWVRDSKQYEQADDLCPTCADAIAAAEGCISDGGWDGARESDSPATCEKCGCELACTVDGDELYTLDEWQNKELSTKRNPRTNRTGGRGCK